MAPGYTPEFVADVLAALPGNTKVAALLAANDYNVVGYICGRPGVPTALQRRAFAGDPEAQAEASAILTENDKFDALHRRWVDIERHLI